VAIIGIFTQKNRRLEATLERYLWDLMRIMHIPLVRVSLSRPFVCFPRFFCAAGYWRRHGAGQPPLLRVLKEA
jgi:hypothetical protein